jgi:hypothetical protein
MLLKDFLDMVKVLKMLYGRDIAESFFKKNIDQFPDLLYSELSASVKKQES